MRRCLSAFALANRLRRARTACLPARPGLYVGRGLWYPEGARYKWHDGYWTRPPYDGAYWVEPYYVDRQYFAGRWEGARGYVYHNHRWDRGRQRDQSRNPAPTIAATVAANFQHADRVLRVREDTMSKANRGFASMPPEKRRRLASMGGRAAHEKGRAHEWTTEEARTAGRKGGRRLFRTAGTGAGESRSRPVSVSRCSNYSRSPGVDCTAGPHTTVAVPYSTRTRIVTCSPVRTADMCSGGASAIKSDLGLGIWSPGKPVLE